MALGLLVERPFCEGGEQRRAELVQSLAAALGVQKNLGGVGAGLDASEREEGLKCSSIN